MNSYQGNDTDGATCKLQKLITIEEIIEAQPSEAVSTSTVSWVTDHALLGTFIEFLLTLTDYRR